MSNFSNPEYLKSTQYRSAANLQARIALHDRFRTNPYPLNKWIFDQIDLPADSRILELGCGRGDFWFDNRERIPSGWQVTLTDLSPGMLADAKKHLGDDVVRYRFRAVDAQAIPFDDDSFDAVFAYAMLFHVPDRFGALSEIQRVLKPGGQLYATSFGDKHMGELDGFIRRFAPEIALWGPSGGKAFTLESGTAELEPFFQDITIRRHDNNLRITEAQPLVDYVLSATGNARVVLVGERLDAFNVYIQDEIDTHGAIHITKDEGLFIARKNG